MTLNGLAFQYVTALEQWPAIPYLMPLPGFVLGLILPSPGQYIARGPHWLAVLLLILLLTVEQFAWFAMPAAVRADLFWLLPFGDVLSALLIGVAAGFACYWGATGLKRLLRADDSLDVFGVHGVGGLVGALLTGVLADPAISGQRGSLLTQLIACAAVLAYSLVMTTVVLFVVSRFAGLRVGPDAERQGLDAALHNERLGG